MDYITKEEFVAWLHLPTTAKIRQGLREQVLLRRVALSKMCGTDQLMDRYNSGVIDGIELTADFEALIEFPEETPDASDEGTQTTY